MEGRAAVSYPERLYMRVTLLRSGLLFIRQPTTRLLSHDDNRHRINITGAGSRSLPHYERARLVRRKDNIMENIIVITSKGTIGAMNIFWSKRVIEGVRPSTGELVYAFPEAVYKAVMSNKGRTIEYVDNGIVYHIIHYA